MRFWAAGRCAAPCSGSLSQESGLSMSSFQRRPACRCQVHARAWWMLPSRTFRNENSKALLEGAVLPVQRTCMDLFSPRVDGLFAHLTTSIFTDSVMFQSV